MILHLKAKHFKGTTWSRDVETDKCAIDKALFELLSNRRYNIKEGVDCVKITDLISNEFEYFDHRQYTDALFDKDKAKARSLKWSKDKTVRRISIPKLKLKDFA